MKWVLQKLFGTYHQRERKRIWPTVERINALESSIKGLTDERLRAKTEELRGRVRERLAGESFLDPSNPEWYALGMDERMAQRQRRRKIQQQALDEILPEAFAVVREAACRTVNMRHFDVQLMGGVVLHEGKIAEMATGEGKTLVATLAAYLNALTDRGVHIVTVNDYLARRDTRWMGPIYHALGMSVGVVQGVDLVDRRPGEESLSFLYDPTFTSANERYEYLRPVPRRESYAADITYGQNNEFGFDYLRDNMHFRLERMSQRGFHFAIVDEVDSILIDEARTPLIISGPAEESTELYYKLDKVVPKLARDTEFEIDEKMHTVSLTEEGITHCEQLLSVDNLYDEQHMRLVHHINQALRAHYLFKRDVDYVVKDNEIIIVDEFTGRLMPGRRWSDGLHQAIEARENVRIREENQTLASVTFQNYFRMYEKLSGMTGTAVTEAQEFAATYKLDVVDVPTNRPLNRTNHPDVIYKTEEEKFLAIVEEMVDMHREGRPVLVGTISIDKSERLSQMLKEPGPALARLGVVCQWALEEMKREQMAEQVRSRLQQVLSRPAMLTESQASELLISVQVKTPNATLTFRLEQILRLVQMVAIIKAGLPHNVLNAKYHEREAHIIAQAGRWGALTIATNMAGRGTDIVLGGSPKELASDAIREEETRRQTSFDAIERRTMLERFEAQCAKEHEEVVAAGGLHVLGTERHEARRIDNQLRGRAGRQGDPGSSRFYLSLGDDLMRVFGAENIKKFMDAKWLQWEEGMPIEHGLVTKSIETAQRRVEGQNFEARKQLLEYDNTMNRQREVIYEQRRRILEGADVAGMIRAIIQEVVDGLLVTYMNADLKPDAWDTAGLTSVAQRQFGLTLDGQTISDDRDHTAQRLQETFEQAYAAKRETIGTETMTQLECHVLLSILDAKWKDHLYMMDALREGIGLRAYGQRNPVVEYQHEAYRMFEDLISTVKVDVITMLLRIQPVDPSRSVSVFETTPRQEVHTEITGGLMDRLTTAASAAGLPSSTAQPPGDPSRGLGVRPPGPPPRARPTPAPHTGKKVGRNEPCPCRSGKKYKKCHGR